MHANQSAFNLPPIGTSRLQPGEIIVDLFAGGGGASEALRQALGRDPDIAINHDPDAIGMHAANHPYTRHHCEDVWHADPVAEVAGRRVGWLHASPDCTHFSQAKGGQPRDRATRSLSWAAVKWLGMLLRAGNPVRIFSMENVRQILNWGPLIAKRDPTTGRVLKRDGSGWTVAAPGERVAVHDQWLIPDPKHAGRTWRAFVGALRGLGYSLEWRRLVASDYGAGTSRERLFLVARRDGAPIAWPAPTHGRKHTICANRQIGMKPHVAAADCIDWSIPCPSIFTRVRPLADKTMRRIARGVQRFVVKSPDPFIVPLTHHGERRVPSVSEPLATITGANRGELAIANPVLAPFLTEHANGSNQRKMDATAPLGTVCAGVKGGHIAVVSAFLEQANGGNYTGPGSDLRDPQPTICAQGGLQRLVTAHLSTFRQHSTGADARDPLATVSAGGEHHAAVQCTLSPEVEAGTLRVAAFLMRYYSEGGQHGYLRDPLDTITTRDRLALVTVHVRGVPYVIVDIGMRMLEPRELYLAQGFPPDYIIDRTADGRRLPKHAQVRMVGNSVSPPPMRAIAEANLDHAKQAGRAAA